MSERLRIRIDVGPLNVYGDDWEDAAKNALQMADDAMRGDFVPREFGIGHYHGMMWRNPIGWRHHVISTESGDRHIRRGSTTANSFENTIEDMVIAVARLSGVDSEGFREAVALYGIDGDLGGHDGVNDIIDQLSVSPPDPMQGTPPDPPAAESDEASTEIVGNVTRFSAVTVPLVTNGDATMKGRINGKWECEDEDGTTCAFDESVIIEGCIVFHQVVLTTPKAVGPQSAMDIAQELLWSNYAGTIAETITKYGRGFCIDAYRIGNAIDTGHAQRIVDAGEAIVNGRV